MLARWLRFNGVGLLGMGLQLTLLAGLVRITGLHHLAATAIAVEAAVLHNFVWHQRWTWRDRPAGSWRATFTRLLRFQMLNGSVSLAGNLVLMALLVDHGGLDPLPANILSVWACGLVNFLGSHAMVFRTPAPYIRPALTVLLIVSPLTATGRADDRARLKPDTLAAWHAYERQVDARYLNKTATAFFAQDAFAVAAAPSAWRAAALAGGTPLLHLSSSSPTATSAEVPDGRVHHWAGAVFVPGVTVEGVLAHLEARAGHEAGAYDDVIASRLLGREGHRLRVYLKLRRTRIITATYDTEHDVEYRRISAARASGRSVATRIAELSDAGTARERQQPPGEDSGYLWKLNAYWRYEATPQGVLIECESVSLSRNVPALLRPFASSIIEGIARESLEKTLLSLKRVLTSGHELK